VGDSSDGWMGAYPGHHGGKHEEDDDDSEDSGSEDYDSEEEKRKARDALREGSPSPGVHPEPAIAAASASPATLAGKDAAPETPMPYVVAMYEAAQDLVKRLVALNNTRASGFIEALETNMALAMKNNTIAGLEPEIKISEKLLSILS